MYKNLSFSCNMYKFDVYFMQIRGREMFDFILLGLSGLLLTVANECKSEKSDKDILKDFLVACLLLLSPLAIVIIFYGIANIFNL